MFLSIDMLSLLLIIPGVLLSGLLKCLELDGNCSNRVDLVVSEYKLGFMLNATMK